MTLTFKLNTQWSVSYSWSSGHYSHQQHLGDSIFLFSKHRTHVHQDVICIPRLDPHPWPCTLENVPRGGHGRTNQIWPGVAFIPPGQKLEGLLYISLLLQAQLPQVSAEGPQFGFRNEDSWMKSRANTSSSLACIARERENEPLLQIIEMLAFGVMQHYLCVSPSLSSPSSSSLSSLPPPRLLPLPLLPHFLLHMTVIPSPNDKYHQLSDVSLMGISTPDISLHSQLLSSAILGCPELEENPVPYSQPVPCTCSLSLGNPILPAPLAKGTTVSLDLTLSLSLPIQTIMGLSVHPLK